MPSGSDVAQRVADELRQYLWEGARTVVTANGSEIELRISRVVVVDDAEPVQLVIEMTSPTYPGSVYAYDAGLAGYSDYLPDDPYSVANIIGLLLDEVLESGRVVPDVPAEGSRTWVYLPS